MKKKYFIIIIFLITNLILNCSGSKKIIIPQQNKSEVSLKARDLYLKGLFYQSEGLYNEALVQFYQALHHDSSSSTIYNSIAENHILLGHFDSALILLKKAEKKDPENVETLDLIADCYFRLRDDENAIDTYKRILKLNPYHEDARKYLIFLYKKTRNDEGLAEQYQELNEYYGYDPENLNALAEIFLRFREFDKALDVYNQIINKDSTDYQAYYYIGNVNKIQGKTEDAHSAYLKVLDIKPDFYPAIHDLALLYSSEQKWQDIIDLFESGRYQVDSAEVFPLMILGEANYNLKNYNQALEKYYQVLKRNPLDVQIQYFIGNVYRMQGKIEEARAAYLKALNIKSDYYYAIQDLALLYASEQKWQDIIDVFEDGRFQTDSTKIFPKILIAEAEFNLKQFDKAREILLPVMQTNNVPDDVYELAVRIEFEEKKYDKAQKYLSYLLDKDDKNKMAWMYRGVIYIETNKQDSAANNFKQALSIYPDDPTIMGFYGSTLQQLGQNEQALPYLTKSHKLNPENLNVIYSLTLVYENLYQYIRSDSLYDASIQQFPDNAMLLNNFSYSLSERNIRLDEALAMVKKALEIDPDNGAYLDTIGWIYYKLKNYNEAEKYIKQAIEVRENSAVVFEHLGDVYYQLKNFKLAKENWQKSLNMQPQNNELKLKLEELGND